MKESESGTRTWKFTNLMQVWFNVSAGWMNANILI